MSSNFLGAFDSSFTTLTSTISTIPHTIFNNVGHVLTYATVQWLDDIVGGMFPRFTGSGYIYDGVRKVVDHKIGQTIA